MNAVLGSVAMALAGVFPPAPSETVGVGASVSTLIVDFGPRAFAFHVRHHGAITGLAALQTLDAETSFELQTISYPFGAFVVGMAYEQYSYRGDGSGGRDYWAYWTSLDAEAWRFSGTGPSFRTLRDGEFDGYTWMAAQTGAPDAAVPEPMVLGLSALLWLLRDRRR